MIDEAPFGSSVNVVKRMHIAMSYGQVYCTRRYINQKLTDGVPFGSSVNIVKRMHIAMSYGQANLMRR